MRRHQYQCHLIPSAHHSSIHSHTYIRTHIHTHTCTYTQEKGGENLFNGPGRTNARTFAALLLQTEIFFHLPSEKRNAIVSHLIVRLFVYACILHIRHHSESLSLSPSSRHHFLFPSSLPFSPNDRVIIYSAIATGFLGFRSTYVVCPCSCRYFVLFVKSHIHIMHTHTNAHVRSAHPHIIITHTTHHHHAHITSSSCIHHISSHMHHIVSHIHHIIIMHTSHRITSLCFNCALTTTIVFSVQCFSVFPNPSNSGLPRKGENIDRRRRK